MLAVFIFIFNVIVVVQVATCHHQYGQCLGFRVAPQMSHVVACATEHTLAVDFGRQDRVYTRNASEACSWYLGSIFSRQKSIILNRVRPSSPFTIPAVRSDFGIVSYILRSISTVSGSNCRATPGAGGEGTTNSPSMRENECAALSWAWLWRNISSSPSSSLAMRVVGSRGCGASFELIDRS